MHTAKEIKGLTYKKKRNIYISQLYTNDFHYTLPYLYIFANRSWSTTSTLLLFFKLFTSFFFRISWTPSSHGFLSLLINSFFLYFITFLTFGFASVLWPNYLDILLSFHLVAIHSSPYLFLLHQTHFELHTIYLHVSHDMPNSHFHNITGRYML